nr:hypothetical protein HmN_000211900 [Hymenolepis microstoma]
MPLKHPPHLKGKEIGLWYAQQSKQNKETNLLLEAELFTLDQKTVERMATVVKEAEKQGAFSPKKKKSKCQPTASVKNVVEILEERDFDEAAALVDDDGQEDTTSLNCWNLQKNRELDRNLREEMTRKLLSSVYKSMNCKRKQLPTFAKKQEFLDLVDRNQVVVISGETGSGKTTQLPQYLLEHAVLRDNGSCTRIVVTQPRRISAISVSERVASERGESLGMDIGYQIRLDSKFPSRPQGSILFCTTGVVLQWFHSDPLLQSVSHIVVDEVHEREMLGDFLMAMLKRILPLRPDLRVILMSATMNSLKFSEFFGNCPHLEIPGRTFPVESIFLEEVLRKTGYQMPIDALQRFERFNQRQSKYRTGSVGEPNINADLRKKFKRWVHECPGLSLGSQQFLSAMDINVCAPPEFIANVIDYISRRCDPGAILVFVPGIGEIKDVMKELQRIDGEFYGNGHGSGAVLYPLHSRLTMANQCAVFGIPPRGKRKIVIATNIAETSITIEDIVYVVDSGQIKITTYDPSNNTSTLAPVLVSKANAAQRRGRAGRVREGKCFHLFSSFSHNKVMLDFLPPEITRTRLEDVILRIKALKLGPVTTFLSGCLDPPDLETILRTLRFLRDIQALKPLPPPAQPNTGLSLPSSIPVAQLSRMSNRQRDRVMANAIEAGKAAVAAESVDILEEDNDVLTPLGHHLANLPLDPQCAKLLILGALFCCLQPALAVAACLSFKDPFEIPLGREATADAKRREFAEDTQSDHWAFYSALREFRQLRHNDRWNFCRENFLNYNTMQDLLRLMQDFVELLYERRYIKSEDMDDPDANIYSHDVRIFRVIIAGAFYPNFVMASAKKSKSGGVTYRSSSTDEKIAFHPKSVNNGIKPDTSIWFAYFEKIKLQHNAASTLFDTTMLNVRPIVFFSSKLDLVKLGNTDYLKVDGWITLRSSPRIPQLVESLKQCLDRLLNDKVRDPGPTNWDASTLEGQIMQTIVNYFLNEAPPIFHIPTFLQQQAQRNRGGFGRGQGDYGRGRGSYGRGRGSRGFIGVGRGIGPSNRH